MIPYDRVMRHIEFKTRQKLISAATVSVSFSFGRVALASCHEVIKGRVPNVLKVCTIPEFVALITTLIIQIVIPVAVVAIVFCGFKFVAASAAGNPSELENAKKTLLGVFIGSALIVGASALAKAIVSLMLTA